MSSVRAVSDPAGWYPDPTARHELRYWDGYAWLDNVSDSGAAAADPLGGKPMPPPSEAAAKAQQGLPPTTKSKTPLYFGGAVVAVVVVVVAALLITRTDNSGTKVTVLVDHPVTFQEDGKDPAHPKVETIRLTGNQVVLVEVKAEDNQLTPGVIAEASKKVVDQVNTQIEDASGRLETQFKDACRNLREEDLGVQGSVVYFFGPGEKGSTSHFFVFAPVGGDYEFVTVLVDDQGNCQAGVATMTLRAVSVDMSTASTVQDLEDLAAKNSTITDFLSS